MDVRLVHYHLFIASVVGSPFLSCNLSSMDLSSNLSCFYAAFEADDSLIAIVPAYDFDGRLPLLSSASVGPFKAGVVCNVPLWVALFLHQRSLCTISPPEWLSAENLAQIIEFERTEQTLWTDSDRLPTHYYEIAKRLTARGVISDKSVQLLVQDLLEVRIDKLRQQFSQLLSETASKNSLVVSVNGIGSQETAILKPFVVQALNDLNWLNASGEDKEERAVSGVAVSATTAKSPALRSRIAIRRFRNDQ